MEDKQEGQPGSGAEVRKRKNLEPEDKLQIYREYVVAKAGKHGAVGDLLRRWEIHATDLTRLAQAVEEGALQQFKERKSRRPRIKPEEIEALRVENARFARTIVEQAAELAIVKKKLK